MTKPLILRNKQIVEYRNAGYTFEQIAMIFNLRRQTVHNIYQRDKDKYTISNQDDLRS